MERINSIVLTLWVSGSDVGGASTSNGGSGGVMVVSGKDVDRRMGMGNISRPRISGSRGGGLAAGSCDVLVPGVREMLGNGVVCRSGMV